VTGAAPSSSIVLSCLPAVSLLSMRHASGVVTASDSAICQLTPRPLAPPLPRPQAPCNINVPPAVACPGQSATVNFGDSLPPLLDLTLVSILLSPNPALSGPIDSPRSPENQAIVDQYVAGPTGSFPIGTTVLTYTFEDDFVCQPRPRP
jgi:hypothetical protein